MATDHETLEAYALGAVGVIRGVYSELGTAKRAWLGIGAFVLAHDVLCGQGEMLSEGVDRALEKHKLLTLGAIAITAGHLANVLPEQIDPYAQLAKAFQR